MSCSRRSRDSSVASQRCPSRCGSRECSETRETRCPPRCETLCEEDNVTLCCGQKINITASEIPYLWFPSMQSVKQIDYVRRLEADFEDLQKAFLTLSTHFARTQFRLRQVIQASPAERNELLLDLEKVTFESGQDQSVCDELPHIHRDINSMGDVRRKQGFIISQLRNQLTALQEASELQGIEVETVNASGQKNDDYQQGLRPSESVEGALPNTTEQRPFYSYANSQRNPETIAEEDESETITTEKRSIAYFQSKSTTVVEDSSKRRRK